MITQYIEKIHSITDLDFLDNIILRLYSVDALEAVQFADEKLGSNAMVMHGLLVANTTLQAGHVNNDAFLECTRSTLASIVMQHQANIKLNGGAE